MAEAVQRDRWGHTSSVIAYMVNCHKTKGRPARPSDFNPFAARGGGGRGIPVTRQTFGMLKDFISGT